MHALLTYFTIDFAAVPEMKPVHFGTGPYDRYTHWKQTVFYLPQDLQVQKGDLLTGVLASKPNERESA